MSIDDLLKAANEKKPADFGNKFKELLKTKIEDKINPKPAENEDNDGAGGEE